MSKLKEMNPTLVKGNFGVKNVKLGHDMLVEDIKQQLKDPVNLDKYSDYLDNLDLKV